MSSWIVVRNWEKFQHYGDKRNPVWIKDYIEQTGDDAYLGLSFAARGVLHGIRLEYARSRRQLTDDTATLSRRLGQRVLKRHVQALVDAGFIGISASKPLAQRYHNARAEKDKEKETPLPPSGKGIKNGVPETPSPYAAHGKEPRLKAAENWVANGGHLQFLKEDRISYLMDEFRVSFEDAERLTSEATSKIGSDAA